MNAPFSASVELYLHVAGECFELGQLGPGFALLRVARAIEATAAVIEVIVDQASTRRPVRLTRPSTTLSRRFEFEAA
ncbi:hypothetical protein [Stieleria mannarensis]|uniref:hypothetical protein n=1 Tax=Stieleria mannarensis TaxID=2755585 RepID=UPI00160336A8|nr:hypothetical protein [Rhodopirellula sp. JC639]